jgi:hypothetical protein
MSEERLSNPLAVGATRLGQRHQVVGALDQTTTGPIECLRAEPLSDSLPFQPIGPHHEVLGRFSRRI